MSRAAVLTSLLCGAGCASYASDYRPPNDGRARVVWDDTDALAVLPPVQSQCLSAVDQAIDAPSSVHFGASAAVVGPHFVFIGPPPPLLHVHVGAHHHAGTTFHGTGGGHVGGDGGKSSGSSNAAPEAVVALAVLAIIAMPGITIGLAAGRPEPEDEVALAIDRVNAYNDLARYPGTLCTSATQVTP